MRFNEARFLALIALAAISSTALAQPSPPPAPAASAVVPPPKVVDVKRFVLEGLSLLKESDVQRELERWLGPQDIDGLFQAAGAVQRMFAQAGYGSVAVSLPPQVIAADGSVRLRIVIGKLAAINIHRANADFDEANVRASLPALVLDEAPQLLELEAQLRLVHQNPAKHLDVLLVPGDLPSTTHAEVVLQPGERVVGVNATADNTGDERSGRWRFGLEVRHANATGRDDVASARILTSDRPGRVQVAMLAWRLPSYTKRLMLDTYVAYARIDGGSTATQGAGDLRFQGSGRLAGVRVTHYLLRSGEGEHSISAALDYRGLRNQCSLDRLSGGACGAAGADLTLRPLRLGYEWSREGLLQLGFGVEGRRNLAARGSQAEAFERARPGARADYSLVQINASAAGTFAEHSRWQARLALQWTDRPLPGAEQFGIGGAATVRGFEERVLIGDRGAALTLEWIGPDLAGSPTAPQRAVARAASWILRPAAFVDAGQVANTDGLECRANRTHCDLSSFGAGLRWVSGQGALKLDVAAPLKTNPTHANRGVRLHAAGQWRY